MGHTTMRLFGSIYIEIDTLANKGPMDTHKRWKNPVRPGRYAHDVQPQPDLCHM
jgi:hypothetical protein